MIRYPVPTMSVNSRYIGLPLLILLALAGLFASITLLSGSEVDFLQY